MLKRLARTPVADEALTLLKEMVKDMSVGDRLPTEHQLVNDMGISRQTVREVLIMLQAEGYVKIVRGKGAFVTDKNEFDGKKFMEWFKSNKLKIQELLEVRMAIEPYAASLSAKRINDKELDQLEEIYNNLIKRIEAGKVKETVELDEKFHDLILDSSRNKGLKFIYTNFIPILHDYRSKAFSPPANPYLAIHAHKEIFMALKDRDENAAYTTMLNHIQESQENILETASFIESSLSRDQK
jgi:GntR family transcriptional regulator, transcriptional repressor for pyruvate dehydrogenase complex